MKITVEELQNLAVEEYLQIQEYIEGKNILQSAARREIHQAIRGFGSTAIDSRRFMLCCICLGPEKACEAIENAKKYKPERRLVSRVPGSVFTGKRR